MLEYYFIVAEEKIGKSYREILDYYSKREITFVSLWDNV